MEHLDLDEIQYPTGSLDTYLVLYKELYKKYKERYDLEISQSIGGKELREGRSISNFSHLEYYLIERGWEAIHGVLDAFLLKSAKYKIGDKIKFIKERWIPKDTSMDDYEAFTKYNIECVGIIGNIITSARGDGEIIYGITALTPECLEDNPSASEKNVLGLY